MFIGTVKPSSYIDEPDVEFNIWTKPDCAGTEYENCNRTWFYFGIRGGPGHTLIKLNIVDLSKQTKMYSQGMVPVTRIIPGNKCNWERIRDRISFMSDDTTFVLSFRYFTPENTKAVQYFAFTYPYTYTELQNHLIQLDQKHLTIPGPAHIDDIYYVRECVCKSLEGRRVDLITISSYHNISFEKETRLKNLFPDKDVVRPFKFVDKKVIFVSARVHPGETPASFVFNGFLNLLLNRDNIFAIALRRLYVFKLIPFLNPDGVYHGHYRTDTRGVNLNRFYLNPSPIDHPSVYAARALIRYHHHGLEKPDDEIIMETPSVDSISSSNCSAKISKEQLNSKAIVFECIQCKKKLSNKVEIDLTQGKTAERSKLCERCQNIGDFIPENRKDNMISHDHGDEEKESGLFLYIDLHGHASKKGIFMYGNHFKDQMSNVECMLLPKIMSINNQNFHFYACNFTEKNMYLKDKRDGLSREGSGRVAVLKLTGLIRSYTLECNYNTGRVINPLPAPLRDGSAKPLTPSIVPPKFTPQIYEEAGRALGPSILDLTGDNPNSRIPNSEFRTLNNMREWLKWYLIGQLGSPTEHAKSFSQQVGTDRPDKQVDDKSQELFKESLANLEISNNIKAMSPSKHSLGDIVEESIAKVVLSLSSLVNSIPDELLDNNNITEKVEILNGSEEKITTDTNIKIDNDKLDNKKNNIEQLENISKHSQIIFQDEIENPLDVTLNKNLLIKEIKECSNISKRIYRKCIIL